MRLAISIEVLDLRRGGAEIATARLIEALSKRGHEVHVLTRSVGCELPAGVKFHRIPANWPTIALRQLSFASGVARCLANNRFDLSLACGRGYAEDAIWSHNGGQIAASNGEARSYYFSPLLQTLRRYQDFYTLKGWAYRWLDEKRFAHRPHPHVIAVSQMVADEFQRDYGADPDRTKVIYNQVRIDRFAQGKIRPLRAAARSFLKIADDEVMILFVGQNFKRKGVRPLVEATARLKQAKRKFQAVVAGLTPRHGESYMYVARQLNCAEKIHFIGQHPHVEELYAAADVFCLPTFYDPCALVIVEAMAGGLPVITSRYNGASEMMRHGTDGIVLAEPSDIAELSGSLEKLFDTNFRRQIGEAAAATARKICVNNPANDIVAVVEELASANHSRLLTKP
jgi:UDP-glucose:(heptosyl)LPS alpha-1,3-glucosyltransferase